MFTGLVEELGTVVSIDGGGLVLSAELVLEDLEVKDSICVNGACLTVTSISNGEISVDIVPETLRRTNLGVLSVGDKINLERAAKLNSRICLLYTSDAADDMQCVALGGRRII